MPLFPSGEEEKRALAQQEEEQVSSSTSGPAVGSQSSSQHVALDAGNDRLMVEEDDIDEELPPYSPYSHPDTMNVQRETVQASTSITDEGRININIDQKSNRLSTIFGPALASQLQLARTATSARPPPEYALEDPTPADLRDVPRLNLLIQVVGSRGDVQPFIALGKVLKERHGHRVRLATHPVFQKFVEENDLEFFSLSGDPSELMAFMVKNPGLIPGYESIMAGDVQKRRREIYKILVSGWRSAVEPGNGLQVGPDQHAFPFVADAIIANPPSFSHIHVAEALNIPLHMMFTMPWSPTQSFPHPLANIQSTNTEANVTNFMSYLLIELFTWQGIGSLINKFREKTLGLEPVSSIWGPVMLAKQRVPFTYCWSPAVIPKPSDWGPHIKVAGFFQLELASSYTPPDDLANFLAAGPPPVYIGFGSIVVDDPNALTQTVFDAVRIAGCRAIVSRGWGKMGDGIEVPETVYMLGNCPHDWLFPRMAAVVHHGGAGTTSAGIGCGKPTVVVPFFGDQPFWGSMVHRAGAGPEPIPHKQLTAEKLGEAMKVALLPETQNKAQELCDKMKQEDGTAAGADSFHASLPLKAMRCSVSERRAASFRYQKTGVLLSPSAVIVLIGQGLIKWDDLRRIKSKSWLTDVGSVDPVTGGSAAILGSLFGSIAGFGELPKEMYRLHRNTQEQDDDPLAKGKGKVVDKKQEKEKAKEDKRLAKEEKRIAKEEQKKERSRSKSTSKHKDSVDSTELSLDQVSNPSLERSSASSVAATSPFLTPSSSNSGTPGPGNRMSSIPRKPVHKGSQSIASVTSDETTSSGTTSTASRSESGARQAFTKGAMGPITPLLRAPVDFSYNIAQGFRNLPLMYGDLTVRPQQKITGLQSGLAVAGKGFGFGFYDGIAGLVTQPIKGAKEEGAIGFAKGFGKGLGGLVVKPGAAIWGLPGYAFKGIWREIEQLSRANTKEALRSARIAQGMQDVQSISEEEAASIAKRFVEAVEEDGRNKKAWYSFASIGSKDKDSNKSTPPLVPSVPSNYFLYQDTNTGSSTSASIGRPESSSSSLTDHLQDGMSSPSMASPSTRQSQSSLRHSTTNPSSTAPSTESYAATPTSMYRSSQTSLSHDNPAQEILPPPVREAPAPPHGTYELSANPSVRELPASESDPYQVAALAGAGRPRTIYDSGLDGLPQNYLPSPSDDMRRSLTARENNAMGRNVSSRTGVSRRSAEIRTSIYEAPVDSSESDEEFGPGEYPGQPADHQLQDPSHSSQQTDRQPVRSSLDAPILVQGPTGAIDRSYAPTLSRSSTQAPIPLSTEPEELSRYESLVSPMSPTGLNQGPQLQSSASPLSPYVTGSSGTSHPSHPSHPSISPLPTGTSQGSQPEHSISTSAGSTSSTEAPSNQPPSTNNASDPNDETQLRAAVEAERAQQAEEARAEEEQIRLALEASLAEFQSQAAKERQDDLEDSMVLEYVKKASLAEKRFLHSLKAGEASGTGDGAGAGIGAGAGNGGDGPSG